MSPTSNLVAFSSRRAFQHTMANLEYPPNLVPPTTIYHDIFACAETNTFCGRYTDVLMPYSVDPSDLDAAAVPADDALLIYAVAQEGVPTAFTQWRQGERGRGPHIKLLQSVSKYVPRMSVMALPLDDDSFVSKGNIDCRTIA